MYNISIRGKLGERYTGTLYYLCNFSINLRFFQNKICFYLFKKLHMVPHFPFSLPLRLFWSCLPSHCPIQVMLGWNVFFPPNPFQFLSINHLRRLAGFPSSPRHEKTRSKLGDFNYFLLLIAPPHTGGGIFGGGTFLSGQERG